MHDDAPHGPSQRNEIPVKTGIITVDPYVHGGLHTHMSVVYQMFEQWGAITELFYTLTPPPLPDHHNLWQMKPQRVRRLGMNAFVMPRHPIPFAWTASPLFFGSKQLNNYDMHIAVTGSAHVAFPLAVKRLPFIIWLACIWEEELKSQVDVGDQHAIRLLNHPIWPLLKQQERFVLCNASHIVANSPHTARKVCEFMPEVEHKVTPLIIPIDTSFYTPATDPATINDDYLLWVARINDSRKDFATALRAFAQVRQQFPELKLVVVSEQPNIQIQAVLAECDLSDAVVFKGHVTKEELRDLYRGAMLFALSSRQEGLGLVILEALACGTPVVSTSSGGPNDLLQNRKDVARLVPVGDVRAFAQAIIDLLSKPSELENMGRSGVHLVQTLYSFQAIQEQFKSIVQEVFPEFSERLFEVD